MKIAVVFDNMRYGGIQRVGISHIRLLKELGHDIEAYILDRHTEKIVDELNAVVDKVKIINFPQYLCPERYYILVERFRWGKYIFPLAFVFLLILNRIVKPFVSKTTEYDIAIAFSGHFNDLNFVARGYIRTHNKVCWLHGAQCDYYLMSRGFAFLYEKIKNLVVLSNTGDLFCQKIEKKFKLNVTKIYNPIKIAENKQEVDICSDLTDKYGEYLLFIGRLAADKDPETIIRAVHYLSTSMDTQKHLVIVGDGPKRKELENLVEQLNISKLVHFEGMHKDVENYYCTAKLFVHSSPLEGLPTTILEALSYELPIVATDSIPGVKEILGDNIYGLICPVGDHKAMAESIKKLLTDDELYKGYKKNGKLRLKYFSPECIKEELADALVSWTNNE